MKTVAVIGTGPRGLSVLERLAIGLAKKPAGSEVDNIFIIDSSCVGAGRIWNPAQDECLLMNTLSSHVTMFSELQPGEPEVFARRLTLQEWLNTTDIESLKKYCADSFVPRKIYGLYLKWFFSEVVEKLQTYTSVTVVQDEVTDIAEDRASYNLLTKTGATLKGVDSVVLALGHDRCKQDSTAVETTRTQMTCSNTKYIMADSAADMDLDCVRPGESVFVRGLGLGFYDVTARLTQGRGGIFESQGNELIYRPSGEEPKIYAGSRSGLPIPARGRNQKPLGYTQTCHFFTVTRINERRMHSGRFSLSFTSDLYPLIQAEMEHAYYVAALIEAGGRSVAEAFASEHSSERDPYRSIRAQTMSRYQLDRFPPLSLSDLARPFSGMKFGNQHAFMETLIQRIEWDTCEAEKGNIDGPLKAALDVIRDVRDLLRTSVEFGHIDHDSFVSEFKHHFEPLIALLTAGPPIFRQKELLALIRAGVVQIMGPEVKVDSIPGKYTYVSSPFVLGYCPRIETYIEGMLPTPSVAQRQALLVSNLLEKGLIREHPKFKLIGIGGGIDITSNNYQVVNRAGDNQKGMFCLGIPTENPKWFTQVGSGTARKISSFTMDAKVLVTHLLKELELKNYPEYKAVSLNGQ
ncbi:FAD/NAD(P)-binding protein [Marinobacter shengliensis]